MRPILAGKIALLVLLLGASATAQWNNTKYDIRKWNLGFNMGLNMAYVRFTQGHNHPDPFTKEYVQRITAQPVPGINLGLILNIPTHKYWDFRFIPQVSLQQRDFTYQTNDSTFKRKLQASYMELPAYFRFKGQFYHNHRFYIMGGAKYSMNLMSEKKVKDDPDLLKINKHDLSLEFAWGLMLYGDRVLLSPEIRYSLGVLNIYTGDRTEYGDAIKYVQTHCITLSLNFE